MMRYPVSYSGNKYKEINKYLLDKFNYDQYDYIAEPFGGIFGFSRAISSINNHCIFLINDIDKNLIKVHNFFKKHTNFTNFVNSCKKIINNMKIKNDYELMTKIKKTTKNDIEHIFLRLYSQNAHYFSMKKRLISMLNDLDQIIENLKNILNRCVFFNMDYVVFCDKIKKLDNILIFFDPPYFNSQNMSYTSIKKNINNTITDNTLIYIDILDFMENSGKDCILILNKIGIFDYLFSPFYHSEYDITYQKSKNKTKHVVYTNI